jgi:S-adenosylmethionine hydrolase
MAYDWISFCTDYGLSDGFVAACHGVIARIAPTARIIDVTHEVPPGDVTRGAAVLAQTVPALPPAVHLAVVDPGVGTARRAIAIETAGGGALVGPDNGLLWPAANALGGPARAVALTNPAWFAPTVSATFHGRDIFAPVAARIALGHDLADAGPEVPIADLIRPPEPLLEVGAGWIEAEVLTVDRFGNVQLAAPAEALTRLVEVSSMPDILPPGSDNLAPPGAGSALRAGGRPAVLTRTFGDAPVGSLLIYADSAGHVAVAVNGGRAAAELSLSPGDLLRIEAGPAQP